MTNTTLAALKKAEAALVQKRINEVQSCTTWAELDAVDRDALNAVREAIAEIETA